MEWSKIDTVLFDMDGVITSESLYWDAAALTVYEMMNSRRCFGTRRIDAEGCMRDVKEIRGVVFCGDRSVQAVKDLGVNTNWDLAYVVFCEAMALRREKEERPPALFERALEVLKKRTSLAPVLYDEVGSALSAATGRPFADCARGSGALWDMLIDCFQHWFLGSAGYAGADAAAVAEEGARSGLNRFERPLIPLEKLTETLSALRKKGIALGIGTGRCMEEILFPLELWNITDLFDRRHWATYTEVSDAERAIRPDTPLAKPHPFVFLKALFGDSVPAEKLACGEYDRERVGRALVVGDAPSDLLAAQGGGFPFAAVLTGAGRKEYFEQNGADVILQDITELPAYF